MSEHKTISDSFVADRMGRFIGQLRVHEGISLQQLAHGLCSVPYLNRIENGEREIGKQLTDAFFQRLGKPAELFERILDWDEFQQWQKRQEIITYLNNGNIAAARTSAAEYGATTAEVLDQQFLAIVELDCCALEGATPTAGSEFASISLDIPRKNTLRYGVYYQFTTFYLSSDMMKN